MSSFDYYNDPQQWGEYQYVSLEDIINNIMMSRDPDDYIATTARSQVIYHAKRGVRELYYDTLREIRAIELTLSPRLTIVAPPDYVNYVRISWKDKLGQLHPMSIDKTMSIAQVYLQDHDYEILFDDEGCVLQADGNPNPNNNSHFSDINNIDGCRRYEFCFDGFQPNKNYANVYHNGKFNFDKSTGVFQFSSDLKTRDIVLEYISDGLFSGCEGAPESKIKIHKFAESTLIEYIYYQLIQHRRNVPAVEKQRARKEYYNHLRLTKRRINTIRYDELMQTFKGANRWVKY